MLERFISIDVHKLLLALGSVQRQVNTKFVSIMVYYILLVLCVIIHLLEKHRGICMREARESQTKLGKTILTMSIANF